MKKFLLVLALSFLLVGSVRANVIVQKGDTLWGLFGSDWKTVAENNGISDPKKLQIGQVLQTEEVLGSTPLPTDNYNSFLSLPLSASASTTYVNELPSGVSTTIYTIFASDGKTPREKIFCSGTTTTPNRLTGCIRGISFSPVSGVIDETAGTGLTHSKNARIAVTDNINFSGKALSMLYGFIHVTEKMTFDQSPASSSTTHITGDPADFVTFYQLNQATSTGGSNASTVARGVVEQATPTELQNGTPTGSTGAPLFVPASSVLASSGAPDPGRIPISDPTTGNIDSSYGGGANSLATLNGSALVVENPANATTVPGSGKIAMWNNGQITVSSTPSTSTDALSYGYAQTGLPYSRLIYLTTTSTSITSGSEQTLATTTLAGGVLGAGNVLHIKGWLTVGSWTANGANNLYLKYGGSTLVSLAMGTPSIGTVDYGSGPIEFYVMASSSASLQKAFGNFSTHNMVGGTTQFGTAIIVRGSGTGAVNSSVNQSLAITANNASGGMTLEDLVIDIISKSP